MTHSLYRTALLSLSLPLAFAKSSYLSHLFTGSNAEWTALGDSYAVGAGTGLDLGWGRCLRFSSSYPELLYHSSDPEDVSLFGQQRSRILNFPACSGATSADILAHQFDQSSTWNWEYGERPSFGDPSFATLTAGGDDIDFVNLVRNCVYDILPWRSCDDQRKASWEMLRAPKLVDDLDAVIKKAVATGRAGSVGNNFRLFVTSYAHFFNDQTEQCDNVTWSILPWPFGNRQKLTRELRQDLNAMTDQLNYAIKTAVARNNASNVHYIDWNTAMEGHRYCEVAHTEPCDSDECPSTWFWEYPHASSYRDDPDKSPLREDEQIFKDHLARLWHSGVRDFKDLLDKKPTNDSLPPVPELLHGAHRWIEGLQNLTEPEAKANQGMSLGKMLGEAEKWLGKDTGSKDEGGLKFPDWLITRVRVFHPKEEAHKAIAGLIVKELEAAGMPVKERAKQGKSWKEEKDEL